MADYTSTRAAVSGGGEHIVLETRSPIRVLAGPGTGKSHSLRRRVERLLVDADQQQERVPRILVVTFTRLAAEDLRGEMARLDVPGAERIEARTLHSLSFSLISKAHVLESIGRQSRVLNEHEIEALLYDLHKRYGDKRKRRKRIRAYEGAWARLQYDDPGYPKSPEDEEFEQQILAWNLFHCSMLIGELVPILLRYLQRNPCCVERSMFDHVLVDEYQDLNRAEQDIVAELATAGKLLIIGDDDQSVYSFKYAHPVGIREFLDPYPEGADHGLEECFRCPTRVVRMANSLIAHNDFRSDPPRSMLPRSLNGEGAVSIIQYPGLQEEVTGAANFVKSAITEGRAIPGEILILTPRRIIGHKIRAALETVDVAVKSSFQEQELEKPNAQAAMARLRLAVQEHDRVALRWLLGHGSSNFLSGQYAKLRTYCEAESLAPWDCLKQVASGTIKLSGISNLTKRYADIVGEVAALRNQPLDTFVETWLPPSVADVDDLRELAREIAQSGDVTDLAEFADMLNQEITQPGQPEETTTVRIMSLHKSKGLSAPVVLVVGCIDGLLPRKPDEDMSAEEVRNHFEEQRRLFYVAITRTKAVPDRGRPGTLYISSSTFMHTQDAMQCGAARTGRAAGGYYVRASPFLSELGSAAPKVTMG